MAFRRYRDQSPPRAHIAASLVWHIAYNLHQVRALGLEAQASAARAFVVQALAAFAYLELASAAQALDAEPLAASLPDRAWPCGLEPQRVRALAVVPQEEAVRDAAVSSVS